MKKTRSRIVIAFLAAILSGHACAEDVAAFYKGRTVNLVISTSPGGDYDTRARLVGKHLGRFIPGAPTVVPQNMPGAGGIRATNYLYNSAPRDGTTIISVEQQIPLTQIFKLSGVEFDLAKGHYIGNTSGSPIVIASWFTSPIKTFDDVLKNELTIGATGAGSGSTQVPAMLNTILGSKFKVVAGYPGGSEIYLAMERGEVAGRATQSLAGWKAQKADWLAEKKLNFLAQGGFKRNSEIPDVPLLLEYAKTEEDRKVVELFLAPDEIARPLLVGPDVPPERLAALQAAFDSVMKDASFIEEAKNMKLEINPMTGPQADEIVNRLLSAPPAVVERARAFTLQ
jgi:tripartite-type tricarboxylate transporter receptor subunit TctC